MAETVWIQEDQLTLKHAALKAAEDDCVVLMVESRDWATRLPHHKQKLVVVWSAMRRFADELRQRGYRVDYRKNVTDAEALAGHIEEFDPSRIVLMEAAEYGIAEERASRVFEHKIDADIVPNDMFLSDRGEFETWSKKRKTLRMEDFYRGMRRRTGLLMDVGDPVGGEWNYDKHNRETPAADQEFPTVPRFEPDAETAALIRFVQEEFPDHFGDCDDFRWPVTRQDAETLAVDFLDNRLDLFGPYQDAIVSGEPFLYHSLLSPLVNIGLIDPLWLCREAEKRYREGKARLNSVEGFIRQIIGWREFVYQVYRLKMPDYIDRNFFDADLDLPSFYWDAETDMRCVSEAVSSLRKNGINHHIQRLMITGNFALIAGINPQQVNEWYWLGYADAWEWVVTPNVIGMSLFADGGVVASKPYAASSNYINKMSDCCGGCSYDRKQTIGETACPFNSLYWDFIDRNQDAFNNNPRMSLVLRNWRKRDPQKAGAIREQAASIREKLRSGARL